VSEETLDPENWDSIRAQGHRMLDDMFNYLRDLRERPVWQPIPQSVRSLFRQGMPEKPGDLSAVHETFMRGILPFAVGNAHPGFMGWVHGACYSPSSVLHTGRSGLEHAIGIPC
jgi:hypothetical protein